MTGPRATHPWFNGVTMWRAIFALILAAMLWAWVSTTEDPDVSRRLTGLQLTPTNQRADLVILNRAQLPTVSVDIRGPRSRINQLAPTDVKAELDLAAVTDPGPKLVPVTIQTPRLVRVASVTPETVPVTIDRIAAKTFTISVEQAPSPASYNITKIVPSPTQVTARGPAGALDKVARVVLPVALGDHRESFEGQFKPEPRDATNALVSDVTIDPATVKASVTVSRIGRTVSIVADIVGSPPAGFRVSGTTVSPSFVVVDGPPDALNQLILISTAPIDVTGQTAPLSLLGVQLVMPPGIRLVDQVTVNVQVQIERQQVLQQFPALTVQPLNIGAGLQVTIIPAEVSVTVSGPLDRLRQLKGNDIRVEIDLAGLGPGSYTLTPRIQVPSDLRLTDSPSTVRVQIDRASTPVPTRTPIPTQPPVVPSPTQLVPRDVLSRQAAEPLTRGVVLPRDRERLAS